MGSGGEGWELVFSGGWDAVQRPLCPNLLFSSGLEYNLLILYLVQEPVDTTCEHFFNWTVCT